MSNFSERYGYSEPRTVIQRESIDNALRTALWNVMERLYWRDARAAWVNAFVPERADAIWTQFHKRPLDIMPPMWDTIINELRAVVLNGPWFRVYDLLEFVPTMPLSLGDLFITRCNEELERHMAAYRFVGAHIVEITSETEIETISEALKAASGVGGATTHIDTALRYLSEREFKPDYRNSIKESVSAVEAVVNAIVGSKGTLGAALKKLDAATGVDTHAALSAAFSKLYGYTSDSDGIRHALMDEPNLRQEDALFMLVTCSAFVNYLIAKASAAGLQL